MQPFNPNPEKFPIHQIKPLVPNVPTTTITIQSSKNGAVRPFGTYIAEVAKPTISIYNDMKVLFGEDFVFLNEEEVSFFSLDTKLKSDINANTYLDSGQCYRINLFLLKYIFFEI